MALVFEANHTGNDTEMEAGLLNKRLRASDPGSFYEPHGGKPGTGAERAAQVKRAHSGYLGQIIQRDRHGNVVFNVLAYAGN